MKTRSIIMVLTLILVGGVIAQAQNLGASSIKIILDGQSYGGTLTALPNAAGPEYTWTLPNASGTLALESAGTGWTTLGNTLGSTGLLGSLNLYDVNLIANNQTRMTLLNATPAVLLPTETALRFGDAAGGEYVGLVSPTTNKTAGYTFVLPDSLPPGEDVRIQVEQISGSIVYLGYTNPNTTGQIGFKGVSAPTCNTSNANYVAVTGMTFEVVSDAIYAFEAIVEVDGNEDNAVVTWGTPTTETQDAAVTILYRLFDLTGNGNLPGGLDADSEQPLTAGGTYILKGYIETGTLTAAEPYTMQLRVKRANAGTQTCITAKSATQLISE